MAELRIAKSLRVRASQLQAGLASDDIIAGSRRHGIFNLNAAKSV